MSGPLQEVTSVQGLPGSELAKDDSPTLNEEDVNTTTLSLTHEQGSNAVGDEEEDENDVNADDDDDDDFDDFTEFASASENIVITNENVHSDPAAIGNEFADFSKCDTPREHNRVSFNEISNVFASTFGSSSSSQEEGVSCSSVAQEPTTNTRVPSNGKHLSHWLNDSSFWQSHASTQKKLKWQTSHAFKLFLASLNINPAQMHNGVPIFAADLGLLEPMKSCSLDATNTTSTTTTTTAATTTTTAPHSITGNYAANVTSTIAGNCPPGCSLNEKQEQANCQSNSSASQVQVNENAVVSTDASDKKSLDKIVQGPCLELTADSLDFLDGCSNSTKDGKAISSLEEELLADMDVPSTQFNHSTGNTVTISTDQILESLIFSAKTTTIPTRSTPSKKLTGDLSSSNCTLLDSPQLGSGNLVETNGNVSQVESCDSDDSNHPHHHRHPLKCNSDTKSNNKEVVTTLSPEAAQILDELPILAFLRKKIVPNDNDTDIS